MLAGIDLSKMCRVCRDEPDCLLDLFVDSTSSNKEPSLAVMLSKCSGCQVDRADGFPQFICAECAADTRRAFRLRRQCRRSMQYFNQMRVIMVELEGIDAYVELENKLELVQDKTGELGLSKEVSHAMMQADGEASHEDAAMLESLFVELVAPTQCKAPESPENVKTKRRESDDKKPLSLACDKESSESISGDSSSDEKKARAVKRSRSGSSSDDNWTPSILKARKRKDKCFKCPQCDASFDIKKSLNLHLRVHTGIRPYQCSHCPRSFTQKGNLQTHIRIHTGERPFKCTHCDLTFRQVSHLRVHELVHTGERPFKCSHCSEAFKQKANLQNHTMTAHTGKMQKPRKRSGPNKTTVS